MLMISKLFSVNQKNNYDFTDEIQNENILLRNFQGRFSPKLQNGYVQLINGGYAKNHNNAMILNDIIGSHSEEEHYSFKMYITRGAEGAGFALVNLKYTTDDSLSFKADSWEQPNFLKSFGVGFDVYNPQTSAWFDENGNFYGREEREISIHWDNKEIHKILSPIEFRATPMGSEINKFDIKIKYVTAGAIINIAINDSTVISQYFIPEMIQYDKKAVFGASTGELTCSVVIDNYQLTTSGQAPKFILNDTMQLLENEIFHAERREVENFVKFKKLSSKVDKVIMTLDLSGPEGGVSAWDVGAAIYIIDKNNVRYEICRYITPYNRPYIWKVDVSDFLPLFDGDKKVFAKVDTWETKTDDPNMQKGWKVNVKLDFYAGNEEVKAFEVQNLWSGYYEYGNPDKPLKEHLSNFKINIPKNTKAGKLRIVVTGHGMSPNSENSAEFRPSERTVIINGEEYYNILWRTDCYLNPCRPQDGTWKFDRAGWAPGDIVHAWEIDLNKYINQKNRTIEFSYLPDDYENTNRGEHYPPHHWIDTQVIFYK